MSTSPPPNYNTFTLPCLQFSHHPPSSASVTSVVIIKLHRPDARNAFTDVMEESLIEAYNLLSADDRVKCIVLTSSDTSNKYFCTGMDLNAKSRGSRNAQEHRDGGGRVTLAMYRCSKPIIAAINGSAVGVGITQTLSANIRVVSDQAKIGFVFGRRGFCMEACSSFFLPRLIGNSRALHLVTTGAVYPAGHKLLNDLFSEVVAPDQVLPTALKMADEVAANVSGVASRIMKDLLYRGPDSPEEAHLLESRLFHDLFAGKDTKEGIDSFMQKRPADFKGTIAEDGPSAYPWWTPVDVRARPKI